MAILDDTDDPSGLMGGSERQLSALESETYAPSAGGDDQETPVTPQESLWAQTQATMPPRTNRSPRIQARVDEINRLLDQKRAAAGADEYTRMRAITSDPNVMGELNSNLQPFEVEPLPKETKEQPASMKDILGRGILRGTESLKQAKDISEGKKPRDSDTPLADYEQPLELSDFGSPSVAAKKLWYGLGKSYPAVALSIAGSVVGSAVGPVTAVVGGALGMGAGAMLQEIGPAYQAERQTLQGDNPDREITDEEDAKAWNSALVRMGEAGIVGAASMALFGADKPAGDALRSILRPVVAGAPKQAAGLPLRIGVQAVGQPAINVAGEASVNVYEGQPWDKNLGQAVAGGLANVVPDAAAHVAGRLARRYIGKPGVTSEQEAALDQTAPGTQGELDLQGGAGVRPPPPAGPGGQTGLDLPGGTGPEGVPPGGTAATDAARQLRLPDIIGPGRQPLGDITPPPTEAPPVQPGLPGMETPVRGPQLDLPETGGGPSAQPPTYNIGGGRVSGASLLDPLGVTREAGAARPIGVVEPPVPPEAGGTVRAPGQGELVLPEPPPRPPPTEGGGPPEPPPPPPPPPPPTPPFGPSRLQERVGTQPAPEAAAPVTPTARSKIQQLYGIEPDDLHPGQFVAKPNGEVAGKGASPAEAAADVIRRDGKVYPPEPGETTKAGASFRTERGSTYEVHEDGTTTRNKSYHPEHGPEDVGLKPRSAKTIYVDSAADAMNLSAAGTTGMHEPRVVLGEDGKATLAWKSKPDAQWGTHANNRDIPFTTEPVVGKHPVELWGASQDVPGAKEAYSGQHAGNKIVEITGAPEAARAAKAEAAAAPEASVEPLTRKATAEATLAKVKAKAAAVTETAAGSVRKKPPSEPVTKAAEPTEKSAPAKPETEVTTGSKEAEALAGGVRTKTGAFTMGEGEEVPPRPPAPRESPMSREAGAQLRGELRRQRENQLPRGKEFTLPKDENKIRHGWRLITGLLKGDVTLARAIELYGTKEEGTLGRPRTYKNLTAVAEEALRKAEDPSIEMGVRKKMAAMEEKGKVESEPYKQLVAHLEMLEAARLNKGMLQEFVNELRDIDRGAPIVPESRGGIEGVVSEARARSEREALSYRATRPEVNEPLLKKLEQGQTHNLHDLLDTVLGTTGVGVLTPQLAALARVLRRVLPNLKVEARDLGENVYGRYDTPTGAIHINPEAIRNSNRGAVISLVHEALHGATADYVDHIFRTSERLLTSRELAHKTALIDIANEIYRVLNSPETRLSTRDQERLAYAVREYRGQPHELVPMIFTEPEVSAVLAQTKASAGLKAQMSLLGMDGRGTSTLWDAFKNVMRSVFGLRKSEHADSILDLVFRPLTEITETGAKYRAETVKARVENIRASDRALGPLENRDGWSLKDLRNAAVDLFDPVKRQGLAAMFHGATLPAIHDFIKPLVPSVSSHLEAIRAVTNASNAESARPVTTYASDGRPIVETNFDKANRLSRELKATQNGGLGELMSDAQYAGMSVIKQERNAHLKTPEELGQQADLQRRFDALSPAEQQTYRETNALQDDWQRVRQEAQVKQMVEGGFPDISQAERDAMRKQMRTKQGVMDVLDNWGTTEIAKQLGMRAENKRALVQEIADSQRMGFVDGDYFGLRRNGEYVVSYGNPKDRANYGVEHFEGLTEAQLRKEELEAGNPAKNIPARNDVSQVFNKAITHARNLFSNPSQALGTFDRAMERAGLSDAQASTLRDLYATQLIQQGIRMATHTMRREGIKGASNDYARNLMGDFLAHTSRMGHLEHALEVSRSLFQAEKEASELHRKPGVSVGDVATAQFGTRELRRRQIPADGDASVDLTGKGVRGITSWTALSALIRPAHLFMNLVGTHAAASSFIGARHGLIASNLAVAKAIGQLTGTSLGAARRNAMAGWHDELRTANWDISKLYRDRLKKADDIAPAHADLLMDRLDQSNLVNQGTRSRELRRMAGPQGYFSGHNYVSRAMDVFSAGEHAMDSALRVAVAKAAFVAEYAKTKDAVASVAYAEKMARDAMPDYGQGVRSGIATTQGALGRFAPVMLQFKQFGLHMYGVQGNLIATAYRSAKGSTERREAIKALAYVQASHALLYSGAAGAVFGSVPMMAGLGVYDFIFGDTHRPHTNQEMEIASRNWVHDNFGKTVADIWANGITSVLGADTHKSLQFTNLLGIPEWKSWDKAGNLAFLIQFMGPSADQAIGMVEGADRILHGDIRQETVAKMMPRIIRDPMEAIIWSQEGLKTHKGDLTILKPDQFTMADLAVKAAGFIPPVVSNARTARATIDLAAQVRKDSQESVLNRVATTTGAAQKEALAEITRYNAVREPADRITGQQIQSRLKEQARINAQPGYYGMRVPNKLARETAALTRFNNP